MEQVDYYRGGGHRITFGVLIAVAIPTDIKAVHYFYYLKNDQLQEK